MTSALPLGLLPCAFALLPLPCAFAYPSHPLAALAEHRLDELPVRVFVAPLHDLLQRVRAVGLLVVGARRGRAVAPGCARGGSRRCRGSDAAGAEAHRPGWPTRPTPGVLRPVQARRTGSGGAREACGSSGAADTRMSCSTPAAAASSSRRPSPAVRSDRRWDSPRQNVSEPKGHQPRLAHARQRQGRGEGVHEMLPRNAGQVVSLRSPCCRRGRRCEQRLAIRLLDQPEHDVATRVQVVGHDEQLAKSRDGRGCRSEIGVAAPELTPVGRAQCCAALEDAPECGRRRPHRSTGIDRRADERPQRRAGRGAAHELSLPLHEHAGAECRNADHREGERRARDPGGQRSQARTSGPRVRAGA